MAILSLVCGVVGLVGGAVLGSVPIINMLVPLCPIAGIIFGAIALSNIKKTGNDPENSKGMATAGLILGIIATVSDILFICVCGALLGGLFAGLSALGG